MLNAIIRLSLSNRALTLALALALCVYGFVAASRLPVDVLPDLNRPTVAILTEAPGLAPEEVEVQVTFPIESSVNGAPGVERVRSVSGQGLSVVHVEFGWGTEIYRNRQMVQERLTQLAGKLPDGVTPHMGAISSIMGEVLYIGITSETLSPMDQRSIADWIVRPAMLSVPGVAQVTVMGGDVRQFRVKADPERLKLYGLTLADLENALVDSNRNTGGGIVRSGERELIVRNLGRARTADDISAALVSTRMGSESGPLGPVEHAIPVYVRDVASVVEQGDPYKRGEGSMMARPAVIMAISKQPTADTRELTARLDDRIAQLRPGLPAGLVLDADIFRQSHFIEAAIGNVIEALRDGSILVIIVLILFLLSVRTTVITLTAIPLSLLTTFIIFSLMGQSINTMTLGGIAVAIGELVDDAIVGVENVHRRLREGSARHRGLLQAVFDATSEVRGPILIGTIIVLLVFVPMLALPGLAGKLFAPLAQAYIISIAASMIVSLTVTPVLAYWLLGKRDSAQAASSEPPKDAAVLRWCKALARRAYAFALPRPWTIVGGCAGLVLLAGFVVTRIGAEFLPTFNEGTAVVTIVAEPGLSLETSDRMGRAAERLCLEVPEVRKVARRTGRAEQDEHALGVHVSELEVDFWRDDQEADPITGRAPPERSRRRAEIFADIRERLAALPGIYVSIGQPISHRIEHLESGVQAQVVLKIFGEDLNTLRSIAESTRAAMDGLTGVTDLQIERQTLIPQVRIRVEPERAARYGFRVGELVDILQTVTAGKTVSQVLDGVRAYDLILTLDDSWKGEAGQAIGDVRILSPSGAIALISDVADIREVPGPNEIARENAQRRIVVSCNIQGADLASTVAAIRESVTADVFPTLPPGYSIAFEGQHEAQKRATRAILLLSAASLSLMFAVLYAYFGSAIMAGQVMLNIPMAFIGAVAALAIAGQPFSVASLIGLVSLCGIASRNGLLMISHYITLMRDEKLPFGPEVVIRGSQERVAPVLMTALTTGLAMIPLLLNPDAAGKEILYPVAIVVTGGLVSCTILDFLVTPTVFLAFARRAAERLASRTSIQNTPPASGVQ